MKNGYENVSVKDIAELTGIRQSAVYNHFSSKQAILDTIYDFYFYYFFAGRPSIEDIEPVLQNGSLLEIIKSVRYEYESGYVRQKMIEISALVFQRQGIDERAGEVSKSLIIDSSIEFVEAVLKRGVEIGRLAPFNTHTISVLISIIRIYTLYISIVDPSPESIQTMLSDEQALYELAAMHLKELKSSR